MTRLEAIKEARKRYPRSKPLNYLDEGKVMGFVEGVLWAQKQQLKETDG